MTAYGIDLGTTYSSIARINKAGRAEVLKGGLDHEVMPSVVYFQAADKAIVGLKAKNSLQLQPDLVAALVKLDIGRDHVRWTYHSETHGPESISALILRQLARSAAEQTEERVRQVVISVPAYFGMAEREATRRAGELAGLEVIDLVAEPVAAALHYHAVNPADGTRDILVYDLGGGTFDVTVMRLAGSRVEVVCVKGDRELGGANWDDAVMTFLLDKFRKQHPGIDPADDELGLQHLTSAVENVRKALSEHESRRITMIFGGRPAEVELTRTQLERLTSVLLDRSMEITEQAVSIARQHGITRFDDIVLVGGMSRMPAVQQALEQRFQMKPNVFEPELAVAKGAAIYASIGQLTVTTAAAPEVTNVLPRAVGLNVFDPDDPLTQTDPASARHIILHLINANEKLPASSGNRRFFTVFENQANVSLEVWEQAGSVASPELAHNVKVGKGVLKQLPPGPPGREFEVTFQVTDKSLLKVHAREEESGQQVSFDVQIGAMTPDQVDANKEMIKKYRIGD